MFAREKTRLELVEELYKGPAGMADRFREALFVISGLDDLDEVKRVARAAMSGEIHGYETSRKSVPYADRLDPGEYLMGKLEHGG